ncbi:ABC transporter ATP-binding protein [Niveispirillum irakense]|uniref:ABC transporter ATP-binding protein n=1 Tax=Niveispirillum irakense TaxID=34011 RepID=UPI000416235F|nr:sn-glycerol-3-phosphate ABC transporter ATP-binding protein UgpC [Niveispirillum irakense]
MARGEVQLRGITKSFGAVDVIKGVDLNIAPGELVVFVGPSGCGKSTLLRLISGLEMPTGGSLHIGGRDVTLTHPAKRGIAMVFQSYALYPHMSVAENMGFGLKIAGVPKAEIQAKVAAAAEILQLTHLLDRKPRALSGGQRQRVAIGRCIVRQPEVFLFDEPLSNLDAALRGQMRVEIARLHAKLDATMVYVTHDQVEAMTLASKIVVLNAGKIEQIGAPIELYRNPANLFVAGFIGSPSMNFMKGKVVATDEAHVAVRLAAGTLRLPRRNAATAPGSSVTVGIRPEHFSIGEPDSDDIAFFEGEVELVERLGGETLAHLRVPALAEEGLTIVKLTGDAPLRIGSRLRIGVRLSHAHLFDADGRAVGTPSAKIAVAA